MAIGSKTFGELPQGAFFRTSSGKDYMIIGTEKAVTEKGTVRKFPQDFLCYPSPVPKKVSNYYDTTDDYDYDLLKNFSRWELLRWINIWQENHSVGT